MKVLTGAVHGEGFFQDASGGFGELVVCEFGFGGVGDLGDVTAGAGFAGNSLAEIIDNDKVKLGGPWSGGGFVGVVVVDAVKNFDQIQDTYLQTCFFQQFTGNPLLQRLAEFQRAAGNGPATFQGLAAAANQEGAAVFDNDTANADDRAIGIFSGHACFSFCPSVGLDFSERTVVPLTCAPVYIITGTGFTASPVTSPYRSIRRMEPCSVAQSVP